MFAYTCTSLYILMCNVDLNYIYYFLLIFFKLLSTGEEGDWKKKKGDRGGCRRIADEAVKKLQAAPHP